MTMESDDPYTWTVEQVCRFFKDDVQKFVGNVLPKNAQLPALSPFLAALKDNDVSGFVLLTSVSTNDLRDEFGVRSFGQRSSILYCINKLRERSLAYSKQQEQTTNDPQISAVEPASGQPCSSETLPAESAEPPHLRSREVQYQDEHGRKRRKLDLTAGVSAVPSSQSKDSLGGYFGGASMPIDRLFFSKTPLGTEVEHPESAEVTVLDMDRSSESVEYNFQFHASQKPPGEAQYVHRQFQHFLQQDPIDLFRHGHTALAKIPYREQLSLAMNRVQSAMVVQCTSESAIPVAIRENVMYLDNGGDFNGIEEKSAIGEYDYLNEKYAGGQAGDSDSDSASISSAAFDRMNAEIEAEWADEQLEVAASQAKSISKEQIGKFIDETIDEFIDHWNGNKRPGKEQNQAWSVWKKMKGSKSRRLGLIEDAENKIDTFDRRLAGQKDNVIAADCWNKEQVVKLCEALKATVLDREEQRWRIDVWRRKQEPAHVVRHGKHSSGKIATSAGPSVPAFVPHPEDRLSMEPAPTPAQEEPEDVFTTPQQSPMPASGEVEDNGFDGSDEASKLGDFVEDDAQSPDALPPDRTITYSQDRDEGEVAPLMSPSVLHYREPRKRALSSSSSSSADGLHGMEGFFTQKTPSKKQRDALKETSKHKFAKPSEPASASRPKAPEVIELSSDSASTPKTNSTRSGRDRARIATLQDAISNPEPENSHVEEVDSWKLEDLVDANDRKRVIIKLLRQMGTPKLFAIKSLWLKRAMVGFKQDVVELLNLIQEELRRTNVEPGPLLQSARLAIIWSCLQPDILEGVYPEAFDWVAIYRDFKMFVPFFRILMQKSDSSLFIEHEQSPSPSPMQNTQSKSNIILIDSDSGGHVEAPHYKRKRKVKYSQQTVESQHIAMERQKLYKAAETQSSNAEQLSAIVGPGSVLLPIDLLRPVEGAHHIHPSVAQRIKDHQINGVRFMWRELTAGATEDDGQGCVLAHAMGLGKTMQAITLLVAVTEAARSEDHLISSQLPASLRPAQVADGERSLRILVLCPPALLDNWRYEIQQWADGILGAVYIVDAANKSTQMETLREWHKFGGVLLMGYSLFSKRVYRRNAEGKAGVPHSDGPQLDEYLLRGPEILVADEAHNVKNIGAGVSIAVNSIVTRSRIALTGTPMSNDVGEMYALISFAAPGFLGGHIEFKVKFGEPIEQGTYADSTSYEQRRSKVKLATLSRLIEPKIHRADITALKGTLQPKVEFVVTLPLTDLQRSVYNNFLDALLGGGKNDKASQVTIFSWLSMLGLLTNHPLAFKRKLNETKKPRKSKPDKSNKLNGGATSPIPVDDDSAEGVDYEEEALKNMDFSEDTIKQITADIEDSPDPGMSAKMHILINILELSERCGDKVLVFSSSIPTLNYVGDLLRSRGTRFGRICGSVPAPKRPGIIADLTAGLTGVLLISTKAGGVGLNIQAANRVVILDFGFNPAHEEQAIGRAYRFGQPKPVFVYRLIAGGTFEDNIYNKQLFKTSLTQRVVDKRNPRRNAARSTRQYLYEPREVRQQDLTEWVGKDPSVFDRILEPQVSSPEGQQGIIRKLTTIETLQREGDDPPLDAEELRQADEEYQASIASAMGPRGQIPNLQNLDAFTAAQARQTGTPRVSSTQQVPQPASQSRLGKQHSAKLPHGHPSTAPVIDTRPKPKIRLARTISSSQESRPPTPHGLPNVSPPQAGSSRIV